jgi:hypothetical protein
MPVILRIRGYRFWFYQADLVEPVHVHVGKAGSEAKFWMNPITLAKNSGFRDHELREIARILADYQAEILQAWQQEQERRDNR